MAAFFKKNKRASPLLISHWESERWLGAKKNLQKMSETAGRPTVRDSPCHRSLL
jgi:hypothetical protein